MGLQFLTLLAVSSGLAWVANLLRADGLQLRSDPLRYRYSDVRFIAVDHAAELRDAPTTLFLDARDPNQYARRRIFGAVSFPADALEPAYADLRDFLAPDMTLIVYSRDLLFSVRVARFLGERGHDAVVLEGGWDAWGDARLPVE